MAVYDLLETSIKLHNLSSKNSLFRDVTGADGNTPLQNTLRVDCYRTLLIDWLEFTFPIDEQDYLHYSSDHFEYLVTSVDTLGLSIDTLSSCYARNGYSFGIKDDELGYTVMFNPNYLQMGIHYCFSGQACAKLFSIKDVKSFLQLLVKNNAQFSRIDYSLDIIKSKDQNTSTSLDRGEQRKTGGAERRYRLRKTAVSPTPEGGNHTMHGREQNAGLRTALREEENPILKMTPERIYTEFINGNLKKRWNKVQRNVGFSGQYKSEDVLYFGSMKSDCMLRIYDKLLERNSKSEMDLSSVDLWVRWEFVFRHQNADALIGLFFESDFNWWLVYSSVLYKMLWVLDSESASDSNISRRPMSAEWSFFLAQDTFVEYRVPKTTSTYDSLLAYICNSVAPSLTGLLLVPQASNDIVDSIMQHYRSGRYRKFIEAD